MGRALKDSNRVDGLMGGSSADSGVTPIDVWVNPNTHRALVDSVTSVSDITATGSIGAQDAAVTLALGGVSTVGIQIAGTFVGTITPEATIDGTTWTAIGLYNYVTNSGAAQSTVSSTGMFYMVTSGYASVRLRMSAYTSGSAVITLIGSIGAVGQFISNRNTPTVNVGNFAIGTFGNSDATSAALTSGLEFSENLVFNGSTWDRVRSDGTTGGLGVGGTVAAGVADSGNPVKIGGKFNTTPPTLTNGQRGDIQLTNAGNTIVQLYSGTTNLTQAVDTNSDAVGASVFTLRSASLNFLYNGVSYDRYRNNTDVSLLASAGRTTTQTSADLVNYNAKGINIIVDMTVIGTGSVTITLNAKDPASGKYYLLLSGAAIVSNVTNVYTVYPGITAAANVSANAVLPRTFQIVITANNANTATYSVGYSLIL